MNKRLHAVLGALFSFSLAGPAFAVGTASYSSELVSAKSLGEGSAGIAGVSNDPFAAYMNPAAMTALQGTQVSIGLVYANGKGWFTNEGSTTEPGSGQVTGARALSVIAPNVAVTTQFLDGKLVAGVAMVAPYGQETHWDGNSPMRYAATDTKLHIIDITPAVAYKVNDAFSVGAGFDYFDTIDGQLDKKISPNSLPGATTDANSDLTATGGGFGYHLGMTYKPNAWNQFGLVYHSNVKMSLSGNVFLSGLNGATAAAIFGAGVQNFNAGINTSVYIPQNIQFGYAFMPNDQWKIEAQASWYDWFAARQLGIVYNGVTATQNTALNTGNPQQFNPRKTLNFSLGGDYKASDALHLRSGFFYQAASLPEATFDPALMDLPRYSLGVGAGYAVTKNFDIDLAYNAVFFHTRAINNNATTGYTGYFDSFVNLVSANFTYKFDTHL